MLFNFGRKKKNKQEIKPNDTFLSIDIGTEYVKTVVYKVQDNRVVVIGYDRTKQRESAMYGAFIINIEEVVDTVDKSIGKAYAKAKEIAGQEVKLPKKAILGIAGELVQGVTILVNVDRENPETKIDKKELENIVNQVRKHTFNSTKEEIASEIGVKESQIEEVRTFINSVYIDGVKVANPLNFTGEELVYRVFSTFAPKIHLDSLKHVSEELGLGISQVIVQPYAMALALKDIKKENSSAIFIDIGGGTTDIAVVQNGDIMGTKMFAVGGRVFTKRIQKDLDLEYEAAEKIKINYADGKLDKGTEMNISKAVSKDIPVWLTGVELALAEFEDVEEYPPNIYLCGGGALLPEIQEGLISYPWMQKLNFKKFPKVKFFFPNYVSDVIDRTRLAKLPMDVTPLALARMVLEIN